MKSGRVPDRAILDDACRTTLPRRLSSQPALVRGPSGNPAECLEGRKARLDASDVGVPWTRTSLVPVAFDRQTSPADRAHASVAHEVTLPATIAWSFKCRHGDGNDHGVLVGYLMKIVDFRLRKIVERAET